MGEVEFEVSVGPSSEAAALADVRRCKLSCREGAWVGPLCKDEHHNGDYRILFRGCHINFEPPHQVKFIAGSNISKYMVTILDRYNLLLTRIWNVPSTLFGSRQLQ